MKHKIKKIQTAIFIKNLPINNVYEQSELLLDLKKEIGDIFDGDPITISIPKDAPAEIPRIVLNSKDKIYSANIALNRVDVFYNISVSKEVVDPFKIQKDNSVKLFNFFRKLDSLIINRIGFVTDIEFEIKSEDGSASKFIVNRFGNTEIFSDPTEFNFRYNKRNKQEEIEMNNLITVLGKDIDHIVKVRTDINTILEIMDNSDFLSDEFEKIIGHTIDKTMSIIKEFPNFKL